MLKERPYCCAHEKMVKYKKDDYDVKSKSKTARPSSCFQNAYASCHLPPDEVREMYILICQFWSRVLVKYVAYQEAGIPKSNYTNKPTS
jgi:hypothetical protein